MALMSGGASPELWTLPRVGRWTLWADRVNLEPIGGIGATSLRFRSILSGFGSGEVTISVDESPLEREEILRLWSWRLWAFYEGMPIWCGIPSSVRDDAGPVISLGLVEAHGYLARRVLDDPVRYDQIEQTEIARQIAEPLADIHVDIETDPQTGFLRDRSYAALEGPYRSNLLENLANVISGPQFRMEYGMSGSRPTAKLRIAYPRIGAEGDLGVILPGNAVSPSVTYDGDRMRTRTYAVGEQPEEDTEEDRPMVIVDRPQLHIPRLDYIDDWPGVTEIPTLTERANTYAGLYNRPVLQVSSRTLETDPPLGTYGLGDDCAVYLADRFHADGVQAAGQLVGIEVDIVSGQVIWTVAVDQESVPGPRASGLDEYPAPKIRPTITERLEETTERVGQVFRRQRRPIYMAVRHNVAQHAEAAVDMIFDLPTFDGDPLGDWVINNYSVRVPITGRYRASCVIGVGNGLDNAPVVGPMFPRLRRATFGPELLGANYVAAGPWPPFITFGGDLRLMAGDEVHLAIIHMNAGGTVFFDPAHGRQVPAQWSLELIYAFS